MIIDWHWEGMTMKMRRGDGLHALTPAGGPPRGLAGGLAATPGGMEWFAGACSVPPSMQKMVTHLWRVYGLCRGAKGDKKKDATTAGLEPAIPGTGNRCLIH